jgi:predicted metalloenzyme YecM
MNDKLKEIIGDYDEFLARVFGILDELKINYFDLNELDHIAYRVEKYEDYTAKLTDLKRVGELHSEVEVRGRKIALFKLDDPIVEKSFVVNYLELPAPSEYLSYKNGLEHAEFVLNGPLERFIARYPSINFNTDRINLDINPEISITKYDITIKFHEQSLVDIRDQRKIRREVD